MQKVSFQVGDGTNMTTYVLQGKVFAFYVKRKGLLKARPTVNFNIFGNIPREIAAEIVSEAVAELATMMEVDGSELSQDALASCAAILSRQGTAAEAASITAEALASVCERRGIPTQENISLNL